MDDVFLRLNSSIAAIKQKNVAPTPHADPILPCALPSWQGMVAQYEAELIKIISNHQDRLVSILKEVSLYGHHDMMSYVATTSR